MKLMVTGGGTAGHINPALAIADVVKKKHPDWHLVYVGNPNHMEYKLATKAGYSFIGIKVKGFQRKINLKNISNNVQAIWLLLVANIKVRRILKNFKPDVVIGTGGYVTGPVMNEAAKMGIKTITHEQNAYPGITTKILSKKVDKVLLAVDEAKKYLNKNCNIEVVGNPIRSEILLTDRDVARNKLGISKNAICILSFGGSLGANAINKAVAGLIAKTYKKPNVYHIHATGKYGVDLFPKFLKAENVFIKGNKNINIKDYINNMDECLAAADIVICRAGAITLSELEAVGRASILIPSPNVAENHQYYNAKVLADAGAAILIEEKNLSANRLYKEVEKLISNPESIVRMANNAKKLAVTNASEKIHDIMLTVINK